MSDYNGPSEHVCLRVLREWPRLKVGREYSGTRYPELGTIYISGAYMFVMEGNPDDDPRGPLVEIIPSAGFARCRECGNLAMNPLPSCGTCGGDVRS